MLASSTASPVYSGPNMQSLLAGVEECNREARVVVIGHRGCGKNIVTAPGVICDRRPSVMENTIVSFNLAASNGADFVEFDVQVTKDGHPVLFHDDFIVVEDKENYSLHQKRVGDLTLKEFYKIGYQKDLQKAEKVLLRKTADGTFLKWNVSIDDSLCTLEEVFTLVSPKVGFNIELKLDSVHHTSNDAELKCAIDAVLKVVKKSCLGRKVFFSSFHPDTIILLRQQQMLYPALFVTDGVPGKHADARMNSVMAAMEVCLAGNLQGIVSEVKAILEHPEAVQKIKAAGLTLLTYGDLNNVAEVFHLQRTLGVDGMVVDHVPEMVIESWKEKGVPH